MLQIIHKFFNEVKTLDEANNFLLNHKDYIHIHTELNKSITLTKIQSRKLLYSLLLYKFHSELNSTDSLKQTSREIILNILNNKQNTLKNINSYFKLFDEWKKLDLDNFLYDIAVSYINLLETKKSVIDHPEWIEHIDNLSNIIYTSGKKLHENKFISIVDNLKIELDTNKHKVVKNMMEKAYWDTFLLEVKENKYDLLYKNYEEIFNILNEIKKDDVTIEIMDINYLKQLINNNLFDENYLISYINFITDKLLKYGIPLYDKLVKDNQIKLLENIQINGLSPEIITDTFHSLMNFLLQLIEIIRIYRKVYNK